ncbi:MAG TPA: hypothetical protein VLV89_11800, partial [Candidatus Acidoferrum sp.]|nr:hypothetical protein [Candidatus Acidoferrum sp.]
MSGAGKQGHVDNLDLQDPLELQFAPREWGVRLADEMRRSASNEAHPEAMPSEPPPDLRKMNPFYGLDEQARLLRPGNELEDIRAWNQLSRKLRTEYAGMKALILKVNEAVKEKTESLRLKAALELCALYKLIQDDGLAKPASNAAAKVPETKTDEDYQKEENEFMMNEAALYDDEVSGDDEITLELPGNDLSPAQSPDPGFIAQIRSWAADSTLLITTVFAHQAAVRTVQGKYFDGHPILFEDIEARLNETIKAMEEAAATFNEYLKIKQINLQAQPIREKAGVETPIPAGEIQNHSAIDIQAIRANLGRHLVDSLVYDWVEYAKNKAIAEMRKESAEFSAQNPERAGRQSQVCEIAITVQGSRNTRIPQPFLEETYTAIVFPNGAVLRLVEVVTHGQIVIIQNMRLKQEAACRVVRFQPSTSADGNVEVEFIQPAPDFWGITFPDEIPSVRSEAGTGMHTASSVSQEVRKEPSVVAPSTAESEIEEKQGPSHFVSEIIPLEREIEIVASPEPEILVTPLDAEIMAPPEPVISTPQVESPSTAPAAKPATEDLVALSEAIVAAYSMQASAAPTEPVPQESPTIENVDTVSEASETSNDALEAEPSPEPLIEDAPPAVVVAGAASLIEAPAPEKTEALVKPVTAKQVETARENIPEPAAVAETKESKPSSEAKDEAPELTARAPANRRMMFAAIGAAGVLIAVGVTGYIWHLRTKAAPPQAAQVVPAAAQPISAAAIPQDPPAGANAKAASNATRPLKAPVQQKRPAATLTGNGAGDAPAGKASQDSADVAPRQPATLPFQIGAPVTHSAGSPNTNSDNTVAAPEINGKASPANTGEQNAILGTTVTGNSVPAPPRVPLGTLSNRNYIEPRVVSRFPVVYPKIALQRRDEGDVLVTAMIDATGKVTGTKAI